MTTEKQTKELIIIDKSSDKVLALFSKENGLDEFINQVDERIKSEVLDVETDAGRKRIGSLARQVGSAKQTLKGMGQTLTAGWKEKTKKVTTEVSRMESKMDAIRDSVLKVREEWQAAEDAKAAKEKERVDAHETKIAEFIAVGEAIAANWVENDVDVMKAKREAIAKIYSETDFEEFYGKAQCAADAAVASIKDAIDKKTKHDDEQAELAELRELKAKADAEKAAKAAEVKPEPVVEEAVDLVEPPAPAPAPDPSANTNVIPSEIQAFTPKTDAALDAKRVKNNQAMQDIQSILSAKVQEYASIEDQALAIIIAVASGKIRNVNINYN